MSKDDKDKSRNLIGSYNPPPKNLKEPEKPTPPPPPNKESKKEG